VARDSNSLNIAAVERDTGLSKDTLRVWERRYGFPAPSRDRGGQRIYVAADVEKLRLVRRLLDCGYRPGKILGQPLERLRDLAAAMAPPPAHGDAARLGLDIGMFLGLVQTQRIEELRRQLSQALLGLGLARFVAGIVAPLNARVGEAWARGGLKVFEEHLYTEAIQGILRNAIGGIPRPGINPPLVLLTTLPREPHGIGLLMAEAFFALEGCRCISLGVQTPVPDIVSAARIQRADIVALSCSNALNAASVLEGITGVREQLPEHSALWVGGDCSALERSNLEGVTRLRLLTEIGPALARWRKTRADG